MFTKSLARQTAERALKTVVQSILAVFVAQQADIVTADWQAILVTAGTAGLLSILTSIASLPFGPPDTPSLVAPTVASAPVLKP